MGLFSLLRMWYNKGRHFAAPEAFWTQRVLR